jgi:hypothetical protein
MMQQTLKKQRGMTAMGWLMVLFLIGFFALLAMKLVPIYLENYQVRTVLDSLKEEALITEKSTRQIWNMVERRLDVNELRSIKRKHVKITKGPGTVKIVIAYNVRKNMAGNLDIIATFNNDIELVQN